MLYKSDKGVYNAASPPEGRPADAGSLLASSLPLNIDRPARMSDSPIFVSASHHTGLDTRSITRKSIIVGIKGGEGRALAKERARLDFAGHRST